MLFYILIAVIVTLFVWIAKKNIKGQYFCLATAILIPSIIGGFRDGTVGEDLLTYGTYYFETAQRYSNLWQFISDWETKEYAYAILCYTGKSIYNDIHSYLFLSEFIKMVLVVFTAWHFRRIVNPCIVVFSYMLFFYWMGLSMMRQSLALCFCLYSLTFYWDKRYIHFLMCIVLAYLFHNSIVFFLYLPLVSYLFFKTKHPVLISILGIVALYTSAISAFMLLVSSGLLRADLSDLYLDSGVTTAKANILISCFMLVVPILFKRNNADKKYWYFIVEVSAGLSLMFLYLSTYFEVAFRVSYYMMCVLFITFPMVVGLIKNKPYRQFVSISYCVLLILYYISNANHGLNETIPYTSKILGI